MKKNIILFIVGALLSCLLTSFVMTAGSKDSDSVTKYGIDNVANGPRYYMEPVDLMRDYQVKVTEDEQYLIIYNGIRKVGVIPFKAITWKMRMNKDDISWLLDADKAEY
jgi:hypothetical protein